MLLAFKEVFSDLKLRVLGESGNVANLLILSALLVVLRGERKPERLAGGGLSRFSMRSCRCVDTTMSRKKLSGGFPILLVLLFVGDRLLHPVAASGT